MALPPGSRLGAYEIVAPLGAGGMGEVYRARDTKLGRDVALKLLPDAFASDPDRLARFQREAHVLASLNHPNIAAIHGLEDADGAHALVMELVEGEDLSQRIARLRAPGALARQAGMPLDEALPIARQIAEALEAAHEQGIIHRDLKPANIKVRADGGVKVLDFGLAKALDTSPASATADNSPTITAPAMTGVGVILGTAAYMAPEQARGKAADKRADIWAFGAVVFEMLTGRRAFEGDLISDVLAAVLKTEPHWQSLPPDAPIGLHRLLRRCLEKDPRRRLQAIGEARVQVENLLSGTPEDMATAASVSAAQPLASRQRRVVAVAGVILVSTAVVAALTTWTLTRPAPAKLQPVRFAIVPPAAHEFARIPTSRDLAVSPDGTRLVYMESGRLMVRAIDQLDSASIGDTAGVRGPFFSPDGRWIGFFTQNADGEIKRVPIAGGSPVVVSRYRGTPRGASWGPDGSIVFATNDTSSGLLRSAAGGEPTVLTTPDTAHGEVDHLFPSVLPGGRAVVFTITMSSGSLQNAQLAVLDLTTGQHKVLIRGGSQAEYVDPSTTSTGSGQAGAGQSGYLVYSATGALSAVRFDLARLAVVGEPVQVVDQLMIGQLGGVNFALSRQGTLVYLPAGTGLQPELRSLVWVTRHGREESVAAAGRRPFALARLSPDGTRVALDIRDENSDIWIWHVSRQTLTPLTNDPYADMSPVWSPNGSSIIWSSARDGDIGNVFRQAADGTGVAERLTTSSFAQFPTSISPDGTRVALFGSGSPQSGRTVSILTLTGSSSELAAGRVKTEPLLQSPADQQNGEISPNGRWIAYQSNESGRSEIYVRPFPNVDRGRWPISPSGGSRPAWARNGRELFYLDGDGYLTSAPVAATATTFSPGAATRILGTRYYAGFSRRGQDLRAYDVSPDGQRFLMIKDDTSGSQTATPASLVVVLNWAEELMARVPVPK